MLEAKVLKKIQQLEVKTKRIMHGMLIAESKSLAKGFGFDFDQIRPYQLGDDVRFIDWKSSTRKNALLVKQYHKEQNKTVLLVVDISASQCYGSTKKRKSDIATEVGTVLAFASKFHNDAISLLLVTDHVERYIPPGKGKIHVHTIIEALFAHKPRSKKTHLSCALKRIALIKRRNMLVFLISDFIDHSYEKELSYVAKKHDFVAICCVDQNETMLPSVGFVTMVDQETGQELVLDLRNTSKANDYLAKRLTMHKRICNKYGISSLLLSSASDLVIDLVAFFNKRINGYTLRSQRVEV